MKLKNRMSNVLFIGMFFHFNIYSKKLLKKNQNAMNSYFSFQVRSLQDILEKNKEIQYIKLFDKWTFDAPQFSVAPMFPHKGHFEELFILFIPSGKVQGKFGSVLINNQMIKEFIWDQRYDLLSLDIPDKEYQNIQKISGKVAVITQFGYNNYFHFLNEILGRLALLEMNHVGYDWLYVADEMPYAKELLQMWGVDSSKIISVKDSNMVIQADEIILPSLLSNTSAGHNHAGSFIHPLTMKYVREKLLKVAQEKNIDVSRFSKKIFISRKDAYAARRILNEDEIFELFKQKGFERYELAKMSIPEQTMLFAQADVVVGEQGSGFTNILFSKPGTKIYEIFQAMVDNCFWWQSQVLGLQYFPCLTIQVNADYFAFCKYDMNFYQKAWQSRISIPIQLVQKIIQNL